MDYYILDSYVSAETGAFLLADSTHLPRIYCGKEDWSGVQRAVDNLCGDIFCVIGREGCRTAVPEDADVIVGTWGKSRALDELFKQGKFDPTGLIGKWESFRLQIVEDRLIIAGSDKRGTIYGVYDLCEKIGVSPWKWWADVPPRRVQALYINLDRPYEEDEPSVKYRGIFINDEYAFDNWAINRGDTTLSDAYERIYELLLRLKANTLWPAMHLGSPTFHLDPSNAANADDYGIVIGTSHCEQMLRNNEQEYLPYEEAWEREHPGKALYKVKLPDSPRPCAYIWTRTHPDTGAPVYNQELLRDYWRKSVEQFGRYECMFTVGMRGLHDAGWQPVGAVTPEEKSRQMEEILAEQRMILADTLEQSPEKIPQLLIPYKEIQEIYDAGMKVSEDITLMWTDDNFGYLRQVPTKSERERSGGAGVYYHVGYHGDPNSYIWLCTTPFALIREEMVKAYDCGADRIWILNVGDLKPAENQMEYFLKLARRIDIMRNRDLRSYAAEQAKRDFGFSDDVAQEYADIMIRFQRLAYSRKPEHFCQGLFNCEAYGDEGQRYMEAYHGLVERAEALYAGLEQTYRPAFFQLLLYPLRSCAHTAVKYICADKSALYARQGRGGCTRQYANASDQAYFSVVEDAKAYNAQLDGKWNLMMDPYQPSFRTRGAVLPNLLPRSPGETLGYSNLMIVPELPLSFFCGQKQRFLDLCNTGSGYVDWFVESAPEWLRCSRTSGSVITSQRIWLTVDWDAAPQGQTAAAFTIAWRDSEKRLCRETVPLQVERSGAPPDCWIEGGGAVSILAAHADALIPGRGNGWHMEPDLGRTGDALKVYPNWAEPASSPGAEDSACALYSVWFATAGVFPVEVYRIPTLNERGQMRFALALDDGEPQVFAGCNAYGGPQWSEAVLANAEILSGELEVGSPGLHTLRLFHIDPGATIEKLVIYTGPKQSTIFGPPESGRRGET